MIALYKFYSYTLGIEETQTNLFLKHEYTTKPTSQKTEELISYMRCYCKIQISLS